MKKVLLVCVLSASLFSCSLLQRRGGGPDDEGEAVTASEPAADAPLFNSNGQEVTNGSPESEVARLNTKVAALETKLDVLSASMERMQAQKSQPVIQAETAPQPSLAAPVDDGEQVQEQTKATQISAAPAKPAHLPVVTKHEEVAAPAKASGAEKEFRSGMQLFQNGQNLEAASKFALMARKYPQHLLAAHALYWAGEASARAQQWSLATENWSELEKRYPRSTYLPEALAGLAKAYESQGDANKAKYYRTVLLKAFPKSPVAMRVEPESTAPMAVNRMHRSSESAAQPAEEQAPSFEEESEGGAKAPAANNPAPSAEDE